MRLESAMFFVKRFTGCYLVSLLFFAVSTSSSENFTGHVLGGPPQSPVRIEVYSDFECPHCRDLYLTVIRQILQDYSNRVCVVYHEFPLFTHRYSQEAARYSEAASRMGQQTLLRVSDALFMDQASWSQTGRIDAVIAKALPREEFQKLKRIMQDPGVTLEVEKEKQKGLQAGINSTPIVFIYYYGRQQKVDTREGSITYPVMKRFLDSVLK
jgi:protein-disulfide isomerase